MLELKCRKILQSNLLFSDFTESQLTQIIEKVTSCAFEKEQSVFQQGQLASSFYLIVKGQIKLSTLSMKGNEKVLNVFNANDTFAEALMFTEQEKYPINAVALENSQLLKIDNTNYINVAEKSPKTCLKIIGHLSQKLHWAIGEINKVNLYDGTYRFISFLLNNFDKQTNNIDLVEPKYILASRLSIKPETLSRIFNKLSKDGLIEIHKNHITLLDVDTLRNCLLNS
jgi:CRP-like cAMP-binding protein